MPHPVYEMILDFHNWYVEDYKYCGVIRLSGPFFEHSEKMRMDPVIFSAMRKTYYGFENEIERQIVQEYSNNLEEFLFLFETQEKIPKTEATLWDLTFLFSE